jgi:hypothetical protein
MESGRGAQVIVRGHAAAPYHNDIRGAVERKLAPQGFQVNALGVATRGSQLAEALSHVEYMLHLVLPKGIITTAHVRICVFVVLFTPLGLYRATYRRFDKADAHSPVLRLVGCPKLSANKVEHISATRSNESPVQYKQICRQRAIVK